MLSLISLFQNSSLLSFQLPNKSNPKTPTSKTRTETNRDSYKLHCRVSCNNNDWPVKPSSPNSRQKLKSESLDCLVSSRLVVDPELVASWLRACCSVREVKRVHVVLLKSLRESLTYVNNNLINGYVRNGNLVLARKVFDEMPERSVVSWTSMINGCFRFGFDEEGLRLFVDLMRNGIVPNGNTFVCVLNLCSRRLDFELGRQVHACVLKGNWSNLIVDSAVVYFYAQCGDLTSAFRGFNRMINRDVVCWTAMVTACSQQGCGVEAFGLFSRMLSEGCFPNEFTVCGVLNACGDAKALKFGKQLHAAIVKKLYKDDVFVGTALVDMYAKCGDILDSRKVFHRMRSRNTVTWTSVIAGYARQGLGEDAIRLFRVMRRRKIMSNNLTIVSILQACGLTGAWLIGREVHARIVKNNTQSNEYIGTTLVWFYCKCGEFRVASKVLQQMPLRDVVSWTAIISGYACLGHEPEALSFLKEMLEEGVEPNSFTCSSALKACANLEAVLQGQLIHSLARKTPASTNVFVGSALIHMYSKCGYVTEAVKVFESMPERNLVSWKAMILGYAKNGLCREALKLMYRMKAEGIKVDDYILTTVLGSCGDAELGEESASEYCLLSA